MTEDTATQPPPAPSPSPGTDPGSASSAAEAPELSARRRFSRELRDLAVQFEDEPARLVDLLEATKGRGYHLLLVVIALPFLSPVPLPGFSIPFGLVVAFIGARLALGQRPWLPARLLERPLPPRFLGRVLRGAGKVVRFLEWFLRPRLEFLHEHFLYRRLAGVLIMVSGLYLVLPLPVPFSNGLPAWAVLLLAASALERDGLCFVAGCVMFAVATAFFLLLAFGGAQLFQWVWS